MIQRALLTLALLLTVTVATGFAQPGRVGGPGAGGDAGGAMCGLCFMGIVSIVWLCIAIWVFNDAASYGMNQFLWALLVFFTGFIGLIVYIVMRSSAVSANNRPRSRPRRRVRRYDDEEEDDDRPRRRRRRDEDEDEDRDSRKRRERWERDADY